MRRWPAIGLSAVVLASLAACGSEPAGSRPGTDGGLDVVATSGPSSQRTAQPSDRGEPIPAEFGPWPQDSAVALAYCPTHQPEHLRAATLDVTAVYICGTERRAVPGDGTWAFAVVRRVTDGADALLEAYATPDDQGATGVACTADLPSRRIVWLHADAISPVRAPLDGCGKPIEAAIAAYEGVLTEVVAEERLAQVNSELVDRTGCLQEWADNIRTVAAEPGGLDQPGLAELPFDAVRACTYAVDPADPVEKAHAEIVAGKVLDAAEQAAIRAALADSVEDPTCSRTGHTRLVVLLSANPEEHTVYVALDGCAVQLAGSWWRATDELRALLD